MWLRAGTRDEMNLKETELQDVDWIHVAAGRDTWQAPVNW
jgi:hypothetical protein